MYFFTADQHDGHANIIQHCGRPFADVDEMNAELMRRHNEVVEIMTARSQVLEDGRR